MTTGIEMKAPWEGSRYGRSGAACLVMALASLAVVVWQGVGMVDAATILGGSFVLLFLTVMGSAALLFRNDGGGVWRMRKEMRQAVRPGECLSRAWSELSGRLSQRGTALVVAPLPEVLANPALLEAMFVRLIDAVMKSDAVVKLSAAAGRPVLRLTASKVGPLVDFRLHVSAGCEDALLTVEDIAALRVILDGMGGELRLIKAPGSVRCVQFTLLCPANEFQADGQAMAA